METINGFRLYSIIRNLNGVLAPYEIEPVEGYRIFKTEMTNESYFIYDEQHNVYRSLIDEDASPNAIARLGSYIRNYYVGLPDEVKSTRLNDLHNN
jgi:hypothetical protein